MIKVLKSPNKLDKVNKHVGIVTDWTRTQVIASDYKANEIRRRTETFYDAASRAIQRNA